MPSSSLILSQESDLVGEDLCILSELLDKRFDVKIKIYISRSNISSRVHKIKRSKFNHKIKG